MDTNRIRQFMEISRLKNFTLAAQHLHINQSTLSRQMAALEQEMGALLFARGPRGVELTEAGEMFLAAGLEIIERFDRLKDDLADMGVGLSGTLTVGVPMNIFRYYPALGGFDIAGSYPDASFKYSIYSVDELSRALLRGDVDLAVNYEFAIEPFGEELTYRHFMSESFTLFVRRGHALAGQEHIAPEQLADAQLALLKSDYNFHPPCTRSIMRTISRSKSGRIKYYNNYENLYMAVSLSSEIGVMPSAMVQGMEELYDIVPICVEGLDTAVPYVIAQRRTNKNPLIETFYRYCIKTLPRGG